jgi:phosphoglycerate kinase
MPKYLTLDDFHVKGKVVLVRVDFNSPIDPKTKKIIDDSRIRAHAETTLKELINEEARVVIIAHQGRRGDPDFIPLKEHAKILSKILRHEVKYVDDVAGPKAQKAIDELKNGEILVLENVRTLPYETADGTPEQQAKTDLVKKLSTHADLFINDAFSAAHRSNVSIIGFAETLPSAAGRIMEKELKSLNQVLENPKKPCIFVLGGAKADDSLEIVKYVLENKIADRVLTGGVVAQVFLAARNLDIGPANMKLLKESELMDIIPEMSKITKKFPDEIVTPEDLAVDDNGKRREILTTNLPTPLSIKDIGIGTIKKYSDIVKSAATIVFSGPMGVYENKEFSLGTRKVFEQIADSKAFSLAGGGHTIGALHMFGIADKISYVSTAGGALTEFLMGKKLPGVVALEKAAVLRR